MGRDLPSLWKSGVPLSSFWVQAILNCVIPWTFVAWASRSIDSSLATVLNSLSPIFAFLLTWGVTRHEAVTARKFGGVLLGLAGVLVIVGVDALSGLGQHTVAELACVAGSLSYGAAAVVGSRFRKLSPLVPSAGATLLSAVLLIPLALILEKPWAVQPSVASMLAVAGPHRVLDGRRLRHLLQAHLHGRLDRDDGAGLPANPRRHRGRGDLPR
jgi:drug/metabolite transporter (DMT)-like permease